MMQVKTSEQPLLGKRIILGVTGSIAAYKAAELASKLTQLGASVHAILTANACEFITPLTFRSLPGNPPLTGLFDEPRETGMAHIDLPTSADLLLIAPATANIIGKIANGIADDWLSTAAMVVRCPVVIAPAMNCNMYTNPVVTTNIERLKGLGHIFVEPESGRLACGTEGVGRLAEPKDIIAEVVSILAQADDLQGMKLLVTAGPTRESIDAVRFISNHSSGKMGYAIAEQAARRGADVKLISGPTNLTPPSNVEYIEVQSAAEMRDAAFAAYDDVDVVISAAAVADYTPAKPSLEKIKKQAGSVSLELVATDDILKSLGRRKAHQILVGFAAETGNLKENATKKVEEKNLDLIVANEVMQKTDKAGGTAAEAAGTSSVICDTVSEAMPFPQHTNTDRTEVVFGSDMNTATLIARDGTAQELPRLSKRDLANRILTYIKEELWRV
jgi:phosphopantothenoylcysteine decarboxylase / phosphopantothenate---cysteine ligase